MPGIISKKTRDTQHRARPIVSVSVHVRHVVGELYGVFGLATRCAQGDRHIGASHVRIGHDVGRLDDLSCGVRPDLTANPYGVAADGGVGETARWGELFRLTF